MKYEMWVKPRRYTGDVFPDGPTLEAAGLREDSAYLVLDVHDNGNIGSEAYFSVINDDGEVWFVSNRYFLVESIRGTGGLPVPWCKYANENQPEDILY